MQLIRWRLKALADDEFRRKQLYDTHRDMAGLHRQLAENYQRLGDNKSVKFHVLRQTAHEREAAKYKRQKTAAELRQDRMK